MLSFLARELFAVAAILVTAHVLGALVLSSLTLRSVPEAVAFRVGTGLGVLSCLVLGLAMIRAVNGLSLFLAALAVAAALAGLRRRDLSTLLLRSGPKVSFRDWGTWLVVLASLALAVPALYPPLAYDATMYHLPAARLHIAQNGLASSPYLHLNFMPEAWELLYTLALLVGTDTTPQLLHAAAMGLVALACVGVARRISGGASGVWAGALWLASPVVPSIATSAYVDIGLTLFVFLGVAAVWRWLETNENGWLGVGAGFLGLAASTKYIGLVFGALVGAVVAAASIRRRRLASLGLFLAVAFAVFCPWLVRTWRMTGTPFGYFWADLFGYGRLDRVDAVMWASHMQIYGYPRTVGSFLRLPWNIFFNPEKFLEPPRISPWLLGGLPFAAAAAVLEKRARWLLATALAYVVIWFLNYQNPRFLLPVLPLFAVGAALGLERALRLREPASWQWALAACLTVAMLWPSLAWTAGELRRLGPIPVTAEQRDRLLGSLPGYEALRRLNEQRGGDYGVYALLVPSPVFFARGRFVGNWFGPNRYGAILPLVQRPDDLAARLRSFGITHLMVGKAQFEAVTRVPYSQWKTTLGDSFRLVYEDPSVGLFELDGAGRR